MKRKSNWLKNLLQWGTLAAIVGFVVYGLTLGEKPADVEALSLIHISEPTRPY